MNNTIKILRYAAPAMAVFLLGFAGAMLLSYKGVLITSDTTQTPPNPELIDHVTRSVVERLQEEGALDDQIERGIERYVTRQRQAQTEAQARANAAARELAKNVRPVSVDRDHIYGNPDAPVSLIEYSDFECPFCKQFHPTAKKLVESFNGKVNWVYRHFPLGFHNPLAQLEAEASECAALLGGNEAFWRYADVLYERTTSNGNGLPPEMLGPIAAEIGLDEKKFDECLESGRMRTRVLDDFNEGTQIGVTGTPGNIMLNNETGAVEVAAGALPFDDMRRRIERILAVKQ